MKLETRRGIPTLLLAANLFLLCLGWIMMVYAYPRLPQEMPFWLSFFGQEPIIAKKSVVFFIYPLVQTLFFACFLFFSRIGFSRINPAKRKPGNLSPRQRQLLFNLMKEFVYLVLIFFNLIFIHIQRSLILLAHGVEKGVSTFYFYSLFGIILAFIPFYKIRGTLLIRMEKSQSKKET